MLGRLPDELRAEIKKAANAAVDSYYNPLVEQKRQELRDLESSRQATLESLEQDNVIERWLQNENQNATSTETVPSKESKVLVPGRNGATSVPSRSAMLRTVLLDFKDRDFFRRDVEEAIFKKWPEARPQKDTTEYKNFSSGLSGLLGKMVKGGQLEMRKGKSPFDPATYRLKNEETL